MVLMEARGIIVSVHDPGSSGPDLSPGRGQCVVFLGKLTLPLSTQVYKCGPGAGEAIFPFVNKRCHFRDTISHQIFLY